LALAGGGRFAAAKKEKERGRERKKEEKREKELVKERTHKLMLSVTYEDHWLMKEEL
jgi:hypothetical protein